MLLSLTSAFCAWANTESKSTSSELVSRAAAITFTDIGAGLPGVTRGSMAWGDFDGDGDLDLALTGDLGGDLGTTSRIYRNEGGGVFTDIGAGLPGVSESSVAWGDYDNDGDLDLALMGLSSTGPILRVYRNDGAIFTEVGGFLGGAYRGSVAWGDVDQDGNLDLVVSAGPTPITSIYRYDGAGCVFRSIVNTRFGPS